MRGKKILLAVTGSIAAYKAAFLVRLFIKAGAEVKVIMTNNATQFISALTLSTLSKNPVYSEIIDSDAWNDHVGLGLWADVMIVAPATASTLSKMAMGNSDSLVVAVYLSAKCPVFFAPAMDRDMWLHPSTRGNIEKLLSYGNRMIDAEEGELASGLHGIGRMAEPDTIFDRINFFFRKKKDLASKKVLITAGPTFEPIDPVRYIGNRSSGKMGKALALSAANRGAEVYLVMGPSAESVNGPNIRVFHVGSANEMYETTRELASGMDVLVFAAAVSDYSPAHYTPEKMKKVNDTLTIELKKNVDIALSLGQDKRKNALHIGFALETNNAEAHALGKMNKKNFDMIVLNSLRDKGAGFQHETNKITIYTNDGEKRVYDLKSKSEVAEDIFDTLVEKFLT